MGLEDTVTSRALPSLLVFVLAACGGRYSSTSNDPDGAGANGSAGTQGTGNPPDDDRPSGGVTMPGTGGASTGTGGVATGGVGVGMAGTGTGFGGTLIGTAGTNTGMPVTIPEICNSYCASFAMACPGEIELGSCSKMCLNELIAPNAECATAKRADYDCLTGAFRLNASCDGALAVASKLCGSSDGYARPCYPDGACDLDIYADGASCHAISFCDGGKADLHCLEIGDTPKCACVINDSAAFDLMTGATSAKDACFDEQLPALCRKYLP